MRKAILIYNPTSGQNREQRAERVIRAAGVLRAAGVEVETCPTTDAGSAIQQSGQAVAAGFDTVIACGGDGTVNETLNGIMRTDRPTSVALGVIPLGSGNLLATDLRLPRNPEGAARALLRYRHQELCPGTITYQTKNGPERRYFAVAAGVGADAELMYRAAKGGKERWGIYAYFLEMARMTLHHDFPMFQVEWRKADGSHGKAQAALIMALRGKKFPGLLRRVRLGSEMARNDYCLMVFRTGKIRHFLHFFASVTSGLNWKVDQVGLPFSTWFRCTPLSADAGKAIHCEADGELLGTLPVEVGIGPEKFKLLMPE